MGIKFNCSKRECRQRIEVEDSMAGGSIACPTCGTTLQVPVSHEIWFVCTNNACCQHVVVDVSEAGRFVKCPACGRILRVPGDPPKALVALPPEPQSAEGTAAPAVVPWLYRLKPLPRLLVGWGVGALLFGVVLLAFQVWNAIVLPARLADISNEIYSPFKAGVVQTPAGFSREIRPVERVATNESGQVFDFYLVPPARIVPARRYPAVVDMTSSLRKNHARDIQFLANAGIFYVSPNSLGITNWGIVPEPQNTRAVYAELLKNPSVDSRRIYISGQSITTVTACAMVDEDPRRWRGVILLEPVRYPKIPEAGERFPSVFISQGLHDRYNKGGLGPGESERFLLAACGSFIPARLNYQPGGHGYQPEQLKAAYKAVVKFILTDY